MKEAKVPVAEYAARFTALGAEPRLRIVRLLLAAHPGGLVVGEIQNETGIPPSTLSHHLEKLKNHRLVTVQREATYLRYRADTDGLRDLLTFLFAECCTRNKAIEPSSVVRLQPSDAAYDLKRRTK
jgi:DNA-binding transcriptional ArsR family regulator